jgi:hypothetical protein
MSWRASVVRYRPQPPQCGQAVWLSSGISGCSLQEPALQFVLHHLPDLFDGLFNLVERLRLVRQALSEHVTIAGEHFFNQALAFFSGHADPPYRRAMRLETASPAEGPMTP